MKINKTMTKIFIINLSLLPKVQIKKEIVKSEIYSLLRLTSGNQINARNSSVAGVAIGKAFEDAKKNESVIEIEYYIAIERETEQTNQK